MAKDVLITPLDGIIQFSSSAGAGTGQIKVDNNDLVISNLVGDVLLGDGASDVFIGNGSDNVDIVFEQNGEIRDDGSGKTITIGSKTTTLILSSSSDLTLQGGGGNVGIGTTTAVNPLQVVGDISSSGVIKGDGGISGSNGTFTGTLTAEHIVSTDDFEITDDLTIGGNVVFSTTQDHVIGISQPGGNTDGRHLILSASNANRATAGASDGGDVELIGGKKGGTGNDGNVILAGGRGKVGIRTHNPTSILEVGGDVTVTHITASGNISASGEIQTKKIQFPIPTSTTANGIFFKDTSSNAPHTNINVIQWDFSNDDAFIYAHQSSSDGTYLVNELRDNTSTDKFVWWFNNYAGATTDSFPLMLEGNKAVVNYIKDRRTTFHRDSNATNGAANNVDFYLLKSGSTSVSTANSLIHGDVSAGKTTLNDIVFVDGNITASGQISASGINNNHFGGPIILDSTVTIQHKDDADTFILLDTNTISMRAGNTKFLQTADKAQFNQLNTAGYGIVVNGHITASENISASGDVKGSTLTGTLSTAAQGNITSLGTLTTLTVDDITIDGSTISDGGDFTLDVEGDITIDANGADIILSDNGTDFGRFSRVTSDFIIKSEANNNDIVFRGQDGGSTINALTLDMSDGGSAIFRNHISASGNITASGNISSSGTITADRYDVGGITTAGGLVNDNGKLALGNVNNLTTQIGKNTSTPLSIKGNITSSGNISSSGTIDANFFTIQGNTGITMLGDSVTFGQHIGDLQIGKNTTQTTLLVQAHMTASGNISASGDIIGEDASVDDLLNVGRIRGNGNSIDGHLSIQSPVNFSGNITSSGNISSSGAITAIDPTLTYASASIVALANGEGYGEIIDLFPCHGSTVAGDVVFHLGTLGNIWRTAASSVDYSVNMAGVALQDGDGTTPCKVLTRGVVRLAAGHIEDTSGVNGEPLYAGDTAGHVQFAAPGSANEYARIMGYCLVEDDDIIYFNPDNTYVKRSS